MAKWNSEKFRTLALAAVVFALLPGAIGLSVSGPEPLTREQQTWVQPVVVSRQYPQLISPRQWHFDFQEAEEILGRLEHDPGQGLSLNRHTTAILQRAVATLPDTLGQDAIERAGFLAGLGFPSARVGDQAARLFTAMIRYQQALRQEPKSNRRESAQARFEDTVALQNHYFGGDAAQQLFAHQRQLRRYLIERRELQEDPALGKDQRERALKALGRKFRGLQTGGAGP